MKHKTKLHKNADLASTTGLINQTSHQVVGSHLAGANPILSFAKSYLTQLFFWWWFPITEAEIGTKSYSIVASKLITATIHW